MTNNANIDDQIRAALKNNPDAPLLRAMDEPHILEQFLSTFRGRNRWLSWMVFFAMFAMFAIAIFCATMFFKVDQIEFKMAYLAGFFYCMLAVGMLKMWQWLQMDKNVILREIKRLELQVAHLTAHLTSKSED